MKSRWKRVLLWGSVGLVVVVLAAAAGFYLWFQSQVSGANDRVDPDILAVLKETTTTSVPAGSGVAATTSSTLPESPSAMNIVLLGYDKRPEGSAEVTEGRSDTIILVRIDPDKDFISLLSVPRDMLADVPGHGLYKLNAAYAFGGGALLIRTIQSELQLDLDHYIALNLEGFQAVTNALGGVYMDIDRHYLNETQAWERINLPAGYQLLDGADALDYVRFRHDDNIDFGRMARQQQFISAVREQALGWNLTFKIPSLVKALFSNLDTDLSANEIIKLAYWVMKLDGGRVKQVEIEAGTGTIRGIFYVLPTDEELTAARLDFYSPPGQKSPSDSPATSTTTGTAATTPPVAASLAAADLEGIDVEVINASGRAGQGALAALWLDRHGATITGVTGAARPATGASEVRYPGRHQREAESVAQALGISTVTQTADEKRVTVVLGTSYQLAAAQLSSARSSAEQASAEQAGSAPSPRYLSDWRRLTKSAVFPLAAPSYIPYGYSYGFQRAYDIVPGDKDKPAIRVGFKRGGRDLYLGVSGSTWLDAPLASPGLQVQGDGVAYTVVGSSTKTYHVWWIRDGMLYWITNTLFADLDREQLLAVAMSMVPVPAASE